MFCFIKGIADLISWSPTFCLRQYKCQRMLNQADTILQIHSSNKDLLLRFNNATWVLRKLFKQFTKVWSFYLQLSAWVHVMLRQRTTILLPKGLLDNHLYTQYSLHEYSYGLTQCKIDYEVSTFTIILSRYVAYRIICINTRKIFHRNILDKLILWRFKERKNFYIHTFLIQTDIKT